MRHAALLISIGLIYLLACVKHDPGEEVPSVEVAPAVSRSVSWGDQVRQVQRGETTQVRLPSPAVTEHELTLLSEGCSQLTVLECDNSAIDEQQLVAVLADLPHLKQLVLHGPVGDELVRSAAALESLSILNLRHGTFGDKALGALAAHPSLELLRFHSPNVSDAGLEHIARIPHLRFLHLIDIPITDSGLPHLYESHDLESLYVDGCNFTEEGLTELIHQLPDLHLHWNDLHLDEDPHAHPHD